ncbi:biotin carboxylase [Caballeronia sp. J97]|uniref:ATP-grasp domain-containing protein n=1 Tax=Caballeronia sp. J97 TaxID=2805429 RepID=UPI002AAF6211|nr:biotin carboxylase [Caballeronia sp. J97]
MLLIIDYNLSRVADVAHMRDRARHHHGADTILIRANPGNADARLCDHLIAVDPLAHDFVDRAYEALTPWLSHICGGVVFSDNAVRSGAALLERIGVKVDSAALALGAFSKLEYRRCEARCHDLFASQRVLAPDCVSIDSLDELRSFSQLHPEGFVVKPSCEGNNRGVVLVQPGDDLPRVFDEVAPYLAAGVICEQLIPYQREFSFDGVGGLSFATEKVSAAGRYPVEVAQVVPARITQSAYETLRRAGELANWLVGQRDGPFHNEVKLSDDGMFGAVVEPNRRPAGMRIWTLAALVYGVDFYHLWVDSVLGNESKPSGLKPTCQAATVMLGVKRDRWFAPSDLASGDELFQATLRQTARRYGLNEDVLRPIEFSWLSLERRRVPSVPRDNSDFVAHACITLHALDCDIGEIVSGLREDWSAALEKAAFSELSTDSDVMHQTGDQARVGV